MLAALLAFALLPYTHPPAPPAGDSLDALVRRVRAAVEAGHDAAERRLWRARHARTPADPAPVLALATLDRLTYHDADAERGYALLLSHDEPGDHEVAGYALLGLGMLRVQETRLPAAEPLLRRAAEMLTQAGDAAGAAQALGNLAIVFSRTAGPDSALAVFAAALRSAPPGDAWLRSFLTCNALFVGAQRADGARAALRARAAADTARRAGNRRAAALCLAAVAQDYERRALVDSAFATFGEVAALERSARNYASLAGARQWQGYELSLRGDFAGARAALGEALALGERTGALTAAGWASLDLADLALTFGDLTASGAYARRASALFTTMGDRWGMLQARRHEGDVALLGGAPDAARAAFEQVLRDAPAISPPMAIDAHGSLAAVALLEGDTAGTERELDAARRLATRLGVAEWREEDAYDRALLALRSGRLAEAAARLDTLLRILPADRPAARADAWTRLAEVHARAGDLDRAEAALERAGTLLDRWRASLVRRELRAAAVQANRLDWDRDLGFATVIAALARAGRVETAFRLAERRRARLLLDGIARRRALSARPEQAVAASPSVLPDAAVRRVLPESTAVLAFVTGRGGEPTTVFVLTRGRLAAAAADPVDDHALEIERFAGLVAAGVMPTELARMLGAAFLRPALALVPPGVRRLVVVPDGPLYRIPLDALDAGDGRLLLDRFELVLAPSASVAATWWAAPPRAPRPRLLAFGDPTGILLPGADGDSAPPRLPAAASEARRIARYAASAQVYTGAAAGEAELRHADLGDVGVLHFATHAQVDEWSLLRSALLLAPGEVEDGRVGVEELVGLTIRANLVVLSACRSGGGAVLAGEGLEGLTEPFLEAGASAVAATLWQIGDRGAAPLAELFYRELARGAPVATALRRAKLTARAEGLPPGVWAAFTLMGDGRVRTALRPPATFPALPVAGLVLLLATLGYLAWRTTSRRKGERS